MQKQKANYAKNYAKKRKVMQKKRQIMQICIINFFLINIISLKEFRDMFFFLIFVFFLLQIYHFYYKFFWCVFCYVVGNILLYANSAKKMANYAIFLYYANLHKFCKNNANYAMA